MDSNKVVIFTDGACSGNPGNGGWGAYIEIDEKKIELSGSENNTTNNRMELKAVISALAYLKKKRDIILFTDSKYVMKGIQEWIKKWKTNNWKTSQKKTVKNKDLWVELDSLTNKHSIQWEWVKGHSGNYGNEIADRLAVTKIKK